MVLRLGADFCSPYPWICDDDWLAKTSSVDITETTCVSSIQNVLRNAHDWHTNGARVKFCLSEEVSGVCDLRFNLSISIIIIICNALKVLIMCTVLLRSDYRPLVTVGDAVASFVDQPDPTTKSMCLASRDEVKSAWSLEPWRSGLLQKFTPRRVRRLKAAGVATWITSLVL